MTRSEFRRNRKRVVERLASLAADRPGGSYDEQALPADTNPNPLILDLTPLSGADRRPT